MLRLFTSCYDTCGNPAAILQLWTSSKSKDRDRMDVIERGVPVDPETMQSSFSSEANYLGPPLTGYQRRCSEDSRRGSRVLTVQPQRRGSYEDIDSPCSDRSISSGSPAGKVRIAAQYSVQKKLLIITVIEGVELDVDDKQALFQIRLAALLLEKTVKQRTKFRSGPRPLFNQTYAFNVLDDELPETVVRLRLYRKRTSGRHQFVGEAFLKGSNVDPRGGNSASHLLKLRAPLVNNIPIFPMLKGQIATLSASSRNGSLGSPVVGTPPLGGDRRSSNMNTLISSVNSSSRRGSMVDDCGRFCALPDASGTPELLISLCYLPNQSKVVVGIEKASGFDSTVAGTKLPDTFVKVSALSQYGDELGKHKSGTFKACADPTYQDTAVFQIPRNELEATSVLIQIYGHSGMLRRKVCLGWLCLGENASSPDAQQHWWEMIQGLGTTVDKWHHLLKPEERT
ncbi:C2 calcium-dependent membrane targeting [Aphelenchoides avenae]|nr:C2 calcium-dependent membrane targeting [Aphelenchus avenae]